MTRAPFVPYEPPRDFEPLEDNWIDNVMRYDPRFRNVPQEMKADWPDFLKFNGILGVDPQNDWFDSPNLRVIPPDWIPPQGQGKIDNFPSLPTEAWDNPDYRPPQPKPPSGPLGPLRKLIPFEEPRGGE